MVQTLLAPLANRRLVWLPIPVSVVRGLLDTVPGMEMLTGLPAETLDYFAFPTTYGTAQAVADLEGTGVSCPRFRDYADKLLDFMPRYEVIWDGLQRVNMQNVAGYHHVPVKVLR